MKTFLKAVTVAVVVLGLWAEAEAAKRGDLTAFKGNFTGTLALSTTTQTFTGPATIAVAAPKSGDFASFIIGGSVNAEGVVPITNQLIFLAQKTFVVRDILFGIEGATPGATGTFSGRKNRLNFNAPFLVGSTAGTFSGTVRSRVAGGKQRLTLTVVVATAEFGPAYTLSYLVKRRVKGGK